MKYMRIGNKVEVEPNAFKLLGACTKRDEKGKIGYFGSGLKYAMATFIREGIDIRIFAGEEEVVLGTVKERFREQEFKVITVNGEKTSLTTSMGVDWKLWQAIREIYCNALDEEECELKIGTCEPAGEAGKTLFFIGVNEELENIVSDWDKYFAVDREYLTTCEEGKIYPALGGHPNIYRRGIRCLDHTGNSLYDYELSNIKINESRIISSSFDMLYEIAGLWRKCATTKMIDKLVQMYKNPNAKNHLEWDVYWSRISGFNQVWLDYFEDKILVPYENAGSYGIFLQDPKSVILKTTLITALQSKFGDKITSCENNTNCMYSFAPVIPDKRISFLLKECLKFLNEVGLPIPYRVSVGIFGNKSILGCVSENKEEIILAAKLFDLGKKQIVCTILEEWAHIESSQGDETRGFQDFLIGQIVTLLENQHGVFL